jgi:hypothetical protein
MIKQYNVSIKWYAPYNLCVPLCVCTWESVCDCMLAIDHRLHVPLSSSLLSFFAHVSLPSFLPSFLPSLHTFFLTLSPFPHPFLLLSSDQVNEGLHPNVITYAAAIAACKNKYGRCVCMRRAVCSCVGVCLCVRERESWYTVWWRTCSMPFCTTLSLYQT